MANASHLPEQIGNIKFPAEERDILAGLDNESLLEFWQAAMLRWEEGECWMELVGIEMHHRRQQGRWNGGQRDPAAPLRIVFGRPANAQFAAALEAEGRLKNRLDFEGALADFLEALRINGIRVGGEGAPKPAQGFDITAPNHRMPRMSLDGKPMADRRY